MYEMVNRWTHKNTKSAYIVERGRKGRGGRGGRGRGKGEKPWC